jgi:outer membrane protein, multidrug efflux system
MHKIGTFSLAVALASSAAVPAASQSSVSGALQPAPAAAHGVAPNPDASAGAFWNVLNDTTLNRLMEQALRGNLELRAAGARVDGAGAARLQAALELTPSVNASAGYTRRRLSNATFPGAGGGTLPDQDLWDSGLNISWEPDIFGRLRSGLRAQNALLGAAGDNVRATQVIVAATLARTYFDLRGTQGQLAVARRNAENQRRTLELTERRLEAGRGTAFDTERARAQLSFTLAAIPALEARVAETQFRIAVLLGRPPHELAAELAAAGSLPALPDSIPAVDAAAAVRMRPDVRSAEGTVAASRALVSSARADYLPRLRFVAGAGYTASTFDAFGRSGTFNYTVGPVISWPALDIGRVKARVDEAQAQELEASARYDQAVLRAREEIEGA